MAPVPSDPAPETDGMALYECQSCRKRVYSAERVMECSACGGTMLNLTKPRAR